MNLTFVVLRRTRCRTPKKLKKMGESSDIEIDMTNYLITFHESMKVFRVKLYDRTNETVRHD